MKLNKTHGKPRVLHIGNIANNAYLNAKILNKSGKYDCDVKISDPLADPKIAKSIYNIDLVDLEDIEEQDALIIAVNHSDYKNLNDVDFKKMIVPNGVVIDVKSLYEKEKFQSLNLNYWRL